MSLPDRVLDNLFLPAKVLRTLRLISHQDLEDDEENAWTIEEEQSYETTEQRGAVFDVFHLLRNGDVAKAKAKARIQLFTDHAVLASEHPEKVVDAVETGAGNV
jgi:hypothetical protein